MKYGLFTAIILAFSLIGCDPIYKYVPGNSDSYKIADRLVIYENDTLKLAVSSEYMQFSKERYNELSLFVCAKSRDLQADFNKIELHTDIQVERNYITSIKGEDPTDDKKWILKKGKEYHFYIYFTIEHSLTDDTGPKIKNMNFNLAKVFQCKNKTVQIPELYFASEK